MGADIVMISVKKPLYRLSLKNCTVHDLFAVLQLYMHILIIIRLDPYKRAQLTKTLASCFYHAKMGNIFLHLHLHSIQIRAEL